MVYVPRKILYPVFIGVFAIIFFSLIYLISFSQSLSVNNASVEVEGENVILKAVIENVSGHSVKDVQLLVKMAEQETIAKIGDLSPGQKFDLITNLPFSSNLHYDVYLQAAFNRPIYLFFDLDEETIRPAKAEVVIDSTMIVGKEYGMIVTLCNVSKSDLYDVTWATIIEGNYFSSSIPIYTIDLPINKCKNLYPTLTPINPGQARIGFILRVGSMQQDYEHMIIIGDE